VNKKIGLLGQEIGYSLSPKLHNSALAQVNLPWEYLLLDTEPENFAQVMDKLRSPQWAGANVTIPYKVKIIPYLDQLSPMAEKIGAVNTVVNCKGRLIGHNTDVPGLARDLKRLNIQLNQVTILGAGGAAAAALWLTKHSDVTIICRRPKQGRDLAKRLKQQAQVLPWTAQAPAPLLINCTPPKSGWQKFAQQAEVVYDVNYHQSISRRNYHNGLGMLVFQAAEAFKLWTGIDPTPIMAATAGLDL